MGQHMSINQKKYKSIVIGYTSTTTTTKIIKASNHKNKSSRKITRLWKDIICIDHNDKLHHARSSPIPDDAITLKDVLCKSQRKLHDFYLARRSIKSLSPNIGLFTMIRRLNLSFNQLKHLPEELGYLHHLESLHLANNQLTCLPDTIGHLTKLRELKLANNLIDRLPSCLNQLWRLEHLDLENNQLQTFNLCLNNTTHWTQLNLLDLSRNPLRVLPVEVLRLPSLHRLIVDGCLFDDSPSSRYNTLTHDPPSLLELCARTLLVQHTPPTNTHHLLPTSLQYYLTTSNTCSFCHGPYFDTYVVRTSWVERGSGVWIPLEYKLCTAHWSDEQDRLLALFSVNRHNMERQIFSPSITSSSSSSLSTIATTIIEDDNNEWLIK